METNPDIYVYLAEPSEVRIEMNHSTKEKKQDRQTNIQTFRK